MMKKTTLLLLGALCATTPAVARQTAHPASAPGALDTLSLVPSEPPAELSLADAVALARARNPAVEAAAGLVMTTRGAARQLGAFPNPEVEWRAESLNTSLEPDRFLTATLPLDLAGRRFALRSSGRAAVRSAQADSLARIREVEYQAASAYWEASLADVLVDVAVIQRKAFARAAAYDSVRLHEGAVAEGTALRTRLEADRARIAEARARIESARARAQLARALGITADSIPRLDPLRPDPTKAAWRPPTLESALERARTERPELRAASAAADAARLRRSAERRALLPQIGLTGGVKQTAGVSGAIIGITMPVPLFDRHGGAREVAAGELRIAEAHLRAVDAAITAEVGAALDAITLLLAALTPEDRDIERRGHEIGLIAEAAYGIGGVTVVEFIEAQRAFADTFADALRWHADLHIALLELNRATGAPILENQP